MSGQGNTDYYVAVESKDLQASTMCINNTGSTVLLAGRRCIALKNLDNINDDIIKYPRQSKYDVGVAEWNPMSQNNHYALISCNERLEVFVLRNETLTLSNSLRAHTRVITDLNWNKKNPDLMATCSADTFVHIWDIRDLKKAKMSLKTVADASQVKFSGVSEHVIATAHEGDIKIWDMKKSTTPLQYISAHVGKIYGLDWNPNNENQIASSSQDSTVKFFDVMNPRKAEFVLNTNAPVWRARYTPFGNGLVTVVVPQIRRGENTLLLWNTANKVTPMHTFAGHRDVVLEFDWRLSRENPSNYELITWSKDQTLLVWKIEPFLQKLCGHIPDETSSYEENISLLDDDIPASNSTPKFQPLQQEFSLLNVQIPYLDVKSMNVASRTVNVISKVRKFTVNLQISFPSAYPHGVAPVFELESGSNVKDAVGSQLLHTLNYLAQQRVSKNRTCLEPCLRQMVATLDQLAADSENDRPYEKLYNQSNAVIGDNDAYIPFPRTSGAKFCSVNTLVCFGRPILSRRLGATSDSAGTPRALSALEGILAKRSNDQMTVSAYYFQKQKHRSRSKHTVSKSSKAIVHIYDATSLFLITRQLAEEYILEGDVATICKHNAAAAAVVGRRDLVQAWTLAELVLGHRQSDHDGLWSAHPCGNKLIISLINHYALQSDIQMAAMLCCIYGKVQENAIREESLQSILTPVQLGSNRKWLQTIGSPYHTIPPTDIVADGWVLPILKSTRSTSLDNLRVEETFIPPKPPKSPYVALYEYYKIAYAATLDRWRLLYNRAEVRKYMAVPAEVYRGVEFIPDCAVCQKSTKSPSCDRCKKPPVHCIVCHIPVLGPVNACIICGHGGHTQHFLEWFETKQFCPKCGCSCIIETSNTVFN